MSLTLYNLRTSYLASAQSTRNSLEQASVIIAKPELSAEATKLRVITGVPAKSNEILDRHSNNEIFEFPWL